MTRSFMEQFIERMSNIDEDDLSYDDTPYNQLTSKSREYYDEFIAQLESNKLNYVDTYPDGMGCIMVYPTPNIELSCIFSYLAGDCCIEIKICNAKNIEIPNDHDHIWIYDDECRLIRSDSIDETVEWIKSLIKV